MAEIVKTNMLQAIFVTDQPEMMCIVIRFQQISERIYKNVFQKVLIIGIRKCFIVMLLLLQLFYKQVFKIWNKRIRPITGFGFCTIFFYYSIFPFYFCLCYYMTDCERFPFEINECPF